MNNKKESSVTRYHTLLVVLHWVLAIMILLALVVGGPMMADMDNNDPEKMTGLTGHMIWGMIVGALIIIRLITRATTRKPPPAETGSSLLNLMGRAAHWTLYLLTFAMVGTGIGIALSAGLFEIVFGGSGEPLPADFAAYLPRQGHEIVAILLRIVIVLHILAWAYHQFVLRDGLFSRMWLSKQKLD